MAIGVRTFDFGREVAVMGIVNRTPDSFYDRGRTFGADEAVRHALALVDDGADLLDVGGVKAGPGEEVGEAEELERVVPVLEAIREATAVPLSVDTFRPAVARAALAAGADLVNDTSGLADPGLATAVAGHRTAVLLVMHSGGEVRTRPFRNHYLPDVVTAVRDELAALVERAVALGVPRERIVVDPGHDFRKNTWHSLALTRGLPELAALGRPVLVALSNKDFLGETLDLAIDQRVSASIGAACASVLLGARIVRVHEVRETVRALRTVEAILGWRPPARTLRGLE